MGREMGWLVRLGRTSASADLSHQYPPPSLALRPIPQGGRMRVTELADLQWLLAPPSFHQKTRQALPSLFQSHAVQSGCHWTHAALLLNVDSL